MVQVARDTESKDSRNSNEIDAQQELMPLRSLACGTIGAELRKTGLSYDSEDIFHDACLIVMRASRRVEIQNVKAFLLKICRRLAWRHIRSAARRERIQERYPTDMLRAMHGEAPISEASLLEARSLVLAALPHLLARDQDIIKMIFIDELSDAEMRERLGLTGGAFRTAKHRALGKLHREILKNLESK